MFIKICANTNVEDALLAVAAGADAVGFVFAPSKRQVGCEEVAEMVSALPARVEKVGVFATDEYFEIESCIACGGLTAVQLHSVYRASLVREIAADFPEVKILQTIAYELDPMDRRDADARFEAALRLVFSDKRVWAVLLDAAKGGASGGLGVALDWGHVGRIVQRTREAFGETAPRVILAGGLRAENVAEAVAALKPWGVDVASGVEAVVGKKSPERLRAFVEQARGSESGRGA
jgi:phosphoribosylanthranilate isomerase